MLQKIKQWWDNTKAWFNYSWSIFQARLEIIFGVVMGAMLAVDWSSLVDGVVAAGDWAKAALIGGAFIVKGIISELGRKAGTVTLPDGQLMPAQVSEKKAAIAVIKES